MVLGLNYSSSETEDSSECDNGREADDGESESPTENVSPPSGGPYYIHLSGSGYVEFSVPQDRLVWEEEESGSEAEDETGNRRIDVTGESKLECQVTQQVYNASGELNENKWSRKLGGMYNWWWWACTIAYRYLRCG